MPQAILSSDHSGTKETLPNESIFCGQGKKVRGEKGHKRTSSDALHPGACVSSWFSVFVEGYGFHGGLGFRHASCFVACFRRVGFRFSLFSSSFA